MGNLLVSIILPTYNRVSLLNASIESVLKQSYDQFEFIVINDCSSDGTHEMLQKLAETDNRLRIFHNRQREGLPASRNKGVLLARGPLIFFSEDDLILNEDCISILVESFKSLQKKRHLVGSIGPRLITVCAFSGKILSSNEKYVVNINQLTGDIKCNFAFDPKRVIEVPLLHSCSLINKAAFLKIGGFETNLYKVSYAREESDFYSRLVQDGFKLFFEPRALVYHHFGKIGGCILTSKFLQEYYNIRNHLLYLTRFYGLSTLFMYPCFMAKFLFDKCLRR